MIRHLKILAWIHVVMGGGVLLLGIAILVDVLLQRPYSSYAVGFIFGMFLWLSALFIPSLVGGLGLLRTKRWARFLIIGVSVEFLFAAPIGTALGAYGLWTLLNRETESIFGTQPAWQFSIDHRQRGLLLAMVSVAAAFVLVLGGIFLLFRRPLAAIPMNGTFGVIAGLALVAIAFGIARLLGIPIGKRRVPTKRILPRGQQVIPAGQGIPPVVVPQLSEDAKMAYGNNPNATITCVHLQPFERAMRAAGIVVVPIAESRVKAQCRIHRRSLERQFPLREPVIYREFFVAERYAEDFPVARLQCTPCLSWIEVLHPYECNQSTRGFRLRPNPWC